ncbi:MAG: hypothetical protein FJZ01_18370 [Candidatus Sericytochromatia bacterium]|nr:hypothetical protein [Candidatus Tanganyikabacteria bacterium]
MTRRKRQAARRAHEAVLAAFGQAREHLADAGLLDVPLSGSPRDTWRHRFPALEEHLARFLLARYYSR